MSDIWNLLELEPTSDTAAIRRAYAKQSRKYHSEEDQEGFLRLRQAYQAALEYAEHMGAAGAEQQAAGNRSRTDGKSTLEGKEGAGAEAEIESGPESAAEPVREAKEAEASGSGWNLVEEPENEANPYADGEAIQTFRTLYTGKRNRDPKAWMDYFTSDVFLDAAWDGRFTGLLLEQVCQLEEKEEVRPSKEFLKWLAVAYQYEAAVIPGRGPGGEDVMTFDLYQGAEFEGIQDIFQIAARGPAPQRHRGNELAVLCSFQEYRYLLKLAEQGDWGEQSVEAFQNILGRYEMSNLRDSCPQRAGTEPVRHPAGLRLITYFFRRQKLPGELYRMAWQKFGLRTAVMGRAGVLYGPLRKIILERLPEIGEEAQENFMPLNKAHTDLREVYWTKDTQKIQEALDAFFARADLMRALRNHRFVENNLLSSWTAEWAEPAFLLRLAKLYETAPDLPSAGQIRERIRRALEVQQSKMRTEADRNAPVPEGPLSLRSSAFFRHWLNTSFYQASDPETNLPLLAYLREELPYLPEWSRRFLAVEDGSIPVPKCVTCMANGEQVEVRFHLRFVDFWVQGQDKPIARPCLPWEMLKREADPETFFFLLPLAFAEYTCFRAVQKELLRRLAQTAAPAEDRDQIAACLAGYVCRLPVPEAGGQLDLTVLPAEWFAEDAEHLYGCAWFEQNQALAFFEQTFQGRKSAKEDAYYEVAEPLTAWELSRQLLAEAVEPTELSMESFRQLPCAVYAERDTAAFSSVNGPEIPRELLGDSVSREQLSALFQWMEERRLKRLELSWPSVFPVGQEEEYPAYRSLVILKDPAGWACLCFDDAHGEAYALIARPDLYWTGADEDSQVIPFGKGELFQHNIHRSFSTIRCHLNEVFRMVSCPNNVHQEKDGLWSAASPVCHGRHKYNLDKRLLGGFPEARSHSSTSAPFYVSVYPAVLSWTAADGTAETVHIGDKNRDQFQQALTRMLQGSLARLCLTWGDTPGIQRHIVLLQDGGRFQLACLVDRTQRAEFCVADQQAYLAAEGKKYGREDFQGRKVPRYLVHRSIISLRCSLEALLAHIHEPERITGEFCAYAQEDPPRPYEEVRRAYAGEK